jgi:hypothetical protein
MQRRPVISVVISVLVIALVYSSFSSSTVFGADMDPGFRNSKSCTVKVTENQDIKTCCWRERVPGQLLGKEYCQTCTTGAAGSTSCQEKKPQALEQPPTPLPFDPTAPLQGGVLEQQQPQTPPTFAPGASPDVLEQLEQSEGVSPGFLERQQQPPADQGAAELPPTTTEGTQPATVEEEPSAPVCQGGLEFNEDLGFCVPEDCPKGQVLDEESGICVLEEPETAEEESAQSDPEEE